MSASTNFALIDNGEMFVYLDRATLGYGDLTVWAQAAAGDLEMWPAPSDDYEARGWWMCEWAEAEAPSAIRIEYPPRREITGAKLKPEFSALAQPTGDLKPEVDADEWRRLSDCEDPSPWAKCYEVTTRDVPVEPKVVDDVLALKPGRPRPKGSPTYRAHLPNALRYQTQYVHLFPGYIDGFHGAVKARLEALTDLKIDFYTHGSQPSIFVAVPGGRGYVYHDDNFRLPSRIEGENMEDALAKWEAELAAVEERVRAAAKVCQHCKGTGRPPGWDAKPAKPKRRRR